jgi:hypothetical protein
MPLCSKCSNLVSQNSAFCNHCGTAVNAPLPTGSTQPQMSVIAPNNQGFSAPTPPPLYASVPPPAKGKSKVFPIILGSLAILILPFVAFNLYRHYQNQIFWESLKTRPTEITKDDFEKVCAHKDDCVGRFIVWEGTVDGDAFQDAKEFHIKSVNGRADVYTVDPLPTRLHDGDDIIFDGFLGEVNSLSPDTINTGYVRKVVATAAELAAKQQAADQAAKAETAKKEAAASQSQQLCDQALTELIARLSTQANFAEWSETEAAIELEEIPFSGPATASMEPPIVKVVKSVLIAQRESLITSGVPDASLTSTVEKFKVVQLDRAGALQPGSDAALRVIAAPINSFLTRHQNDFDQAVHSCKTTPTDVPQSTSLQPNQ